MPATTADQGLLDRRFALVTIGSWGLVFLAGFEALAVTTVMPIVSADLHGRALYSLAFSATIAASIIGTVAGGAWSDRRGPIVPLFVAIGVFTLGLAVAGTAQTMEVFVAGRFLQGLGAGAETVALYVLIGRVYPTALHTRLFGAFAAAWVLPSLIGPFAAGLVTDALSWHWVFLGVIALVAVATSLVIPGIRGLAEETREDKPGEGGRRVAISVVVAAALVAMGYGRELGGHLGWAVIPLMLVVVGFAVRPLVPKGTYRAVRGLPATVLLSAAAGAVFFGTEVYLPLMLHDSYGLPAWLSGITLTTGAIAWALGSNLQGKYGDRFTEVAAMRMGAVLLAGGALIELVTALFHLHQVVAAIGWFAAGGGMGTLYPRANALMLRLSEPGTEGFNVSAKNIADSVGGSVALAVTGMLIATGSFVPVFLFSTAAGVLVVLAAGRTGPRSE